MKFLYLLTFLTIFYIAETNLFCQEVIIDGSILFGPNSSCPASIDLLNNNKGILINRVNLTSTTDVATVPLPCHSMIVYNLNTQNDITPGFYWWDALAAIPHWVKFITGSVSGTGDPWLLTGNNNSFTDYTNNLLGTLAGTNMPLNFIVNGQKAGRIEIAGGNTFLGYQNGNVNTGGANTGTGFQALIKNIGDYNVANGYKSLFENKTGSQNTALGSYALQSNSTTNRQTAVGYVALRNSVGEDNTATGSDALRQNNGGDRNTANGSASLVGSHGDDNIGIGYASGSNVNNGDNIIVIGSNLPGVDVSNTTYIANIYGTTVAPGVNGSGGTVSQVVVNSDGKLGTMPTAGSLLSDDWLLVGNSLLPGGNSNINASSFIGTQAGVNFPLQFKVNAVQSGYIDYDPNIANTFLGFNSGGNATTGYQNTAVGYNALTSNTTGHWNTAVGYLALESNTSGERNTATGNFALQENTTGVLNTATGNFALQSNTTGKYNTAIGDASLRGNIDGYFNTAAGYYALMNNINGYYNTATGIDALYSNISGYRNTADGTLALNYSHGNDNIGIGHMSGSNITTGNNIIVIGTSLPGVNTSNTSYIANIYGTTVAPGVNGSGGTVSQVVVNSDGQLGTIPTAGLGTDNDDWKLLGNANTAEGTNFLGTTNQNYLDFRVNNLRSGHIDWDINKGNTFFGFSAGIASTGTYNTALGYLALTSNTTGKYNTAIGNMVLRDNVDGTDNTATGDESMARATHGSRNTANGVGTLIENTYGNENTAIGFAALNANTTGSQNTAIGDTSLFNNTIGMNNVANGHGALYSNTSGSSNVAVGSNALYKNTTGIKNTGSGSFALFENTIGEGNTATGYYSLFSNTSGRNNTATGLYALNGNLTGHQNTATGDGALLVNDADFNTATGTHSLYENTSGTNNTGDGVDALRHNVTGNYNAALGRGSLLNSNGDNNIGIGYLSGSAVTTGDNIIVIGNLPGVDVSNTTYMANIYGTTVAPGVNGAGGTVSQVFVNSDGKLGTIPPPGLGTDTDDWKLLGNSISTVEGTNFLGTTNQKYLDFRVNDLRSGHIDWANTSYAANTFFGFRAGIANKGGYNTATGYEAFLTNTDGSYNVATGYHALTSNTIGIDNTADGSMALANNTNASQNVAIGKEALFSQNFTYSTIPYSTFNVAVGYQAMFKNNPSSNNNGIENTAIGSLALHENVVGNMNTATGYGALYYNKSNYNTATGNLALFRNATGHNNTAIGNFAMQTNNDGYDNTATGSEALKQNFSGCANTATGVRALLLNDGYQNTASGTEALRNNVDGSHNTAMGHSSLFNSTGDYNIGIGENSGSNITTGNNIIVIGTGLQGQNAPDNRTYIANIYPTTVTGKVVYVDAYGMLGTNNATSTDPSDDWLLVGNSPLPGGNSNITASSFLGTQANVNFPLTFKVNAVRSGYIDYNPTLANTFLGFNSGGVATITGEQNTAIGYEALLVNNGGEKNVATGYRTLYKNIDGAYNTANGNSALYSNGEGSWNTAIGANALYTNIDGFQNTAAGGYALADNESGENNTASGYYSLKVNKGSYNSAFGSMALEKFVNGAYNTGIGFKSLDNLTDGNSNIGIGYLSGSNVTTGSNIIVIGSGLSGQNSPDNSTYVANIYGTTVSGVAMSPVLSVVVNSDGLLGTITTPGTGLDANWKLLGNPLTTEGTDFLGTTDQRYLDFRVNDKRSGHIDWDNTKANTFFGYSTGINNTGAFNTATGYLALTTNTTGSRNTATGDTSLFNNTTGNNNVANGHGSLFSNTTGSSNVAVGSNALYKSVKFNGSVAVGESALYNNGVGANPYDLATNHEATCNVAVGFATLWTNNTGWYNTGVGFNAIASNTTGIGNTGTGGSSMEHNTTGWYNTATGLLSMAVYQNGSGNVATGYFALGGYFTGILTWPSTTGWPSEPANYSNLVPGGSRNTAEGMLALYKTTGDDNIGIGFMSGSNVTTGKNIIVIGSDLPGVNVNNTTYMANIYGTTIAPGINGAGGTVSQVVVNSDGKLGTMPSAGLGTDNDDWKLLGNSISTTEGTNFLGTTNQKYLDFRVNNLRSGHIDWDNTKANTFFGFSAGIVTTGAYNTASGYLALNSNTSGEGNTATGFQALKANLSGKSNSAFGSNALTNSTGSYNIGIGIQSGSNVTTGSNIIVIGSNLTGGNTNNTTYIANIYPTNVTGKAVYVDANGMLGTNTGSAQSDNWLLAGNNSASNITATSFLGTAVNTGVSLKFKVEGEKSGLIDYNSSANTYLGYRSGNSTTTGFQNTTIGYEALFSAISGENNTALGFRTLYANTGNNNVATGSAALFNNITGHDNDAIGYQALASNQSGFNNIAFGTEAIKNSSGNNNIGIGYKSGSNVTTGNNIIVIGSNLTGQNTPDNRTYIANIHGTTVSATAMAPIKTVVVNSDGQLGTITAPLPFTHYLGEQYNCGIIFYLFRDAYGAEHGLIVSVDDISTSSAWSSPSNTTTGATSPWDGSLITTTTPHGNSDIIIANTTTSAALTCASYTASSCIGTNVWYLPSMDELSLLFDASFIVNKTLKSISKPYLSNAIYWSSTETASGTAAIRGFGTLSQNQGSYAKTGSWYVRAIRAF